MTSPRAPSSIARRTLASVSWNVIAQAIGVVVGFTRSVMLARLLEVETFGVYAGALAVVQLASVAGTFGLVGAFLHRAPETADEGRAASVHLSLQLIAAVAWLGIMLTFAFVWTEGANRLALLVISGATALDMITGVQQSILVRRVVHRRLALLNTLSTLLVSVVAVGLAWIGVELWALLATEILGALFLFGGVYLVRPAWRARLGWDRRIARYFLRFGLPTMAATIVEAGLQKLDDIWVRTNLGALQMGYYSRAYTFATYPRSILAAPVTAVAGGTFAELAGNRLQLSRAFFRTTALLVRAGFLFAGWLLVIAPEFVGILLGSRWLPMVPIFRLLAVFALLDPLRDLVGSLYLAVGQPQRLMRYRLLQLGVLVAGLFMLGTRYGTVGVAIAVDAMLVLGIALLLQGARGWVDFSWLRLFGAPAARVLAGVAGALGLVSLLPGDASLWLSAIVKSAVFLGLFCALLLALERAAITEMVRQVWGQMGRKRAP